MNMSAAKCTPPASQHIAIPVLLTLVTIAAVFWSSGLNAHAATAAAKDKQQDWTTYGGSAADDRFSPLTQINRGNVDQLKVAWTFDTGEPGGLQTSPLIIGGILYGFTPTQKVIALDAASGKKIWTFDSGTLGLQPTRGFSYWTDGTRSILFAGLLSYLYALDPATGKPLTVFGENGRIDLRKDLGQSDIKESFAALTSPGVIYKDSIIIGFRAPESKPALRGDIRAYDVRSGKLRWVFHTIPHPGEEGYESWPKDAWKYTGAANNWAGMALDEARGIVYVPTGSAVDDFYGADRLGNDRFADTLLALDAATGKRIWDFQGVHHDIWDRDFPSPPSLVTVRSGNRHVDAVAQTTKQGFLYLFNRATGKPLFPIVETPFPPSNVPGEKTSPTQPVPQLPAPFSRQLLTEDMLTTRTPEAHAWALHEFHTYRSDGLFVPFSVDRQTVAFPGFDGGAEWGGSAVDTRTGVLYVNANDLPWTGILYEDKSHGNLGASIYVSQCAACHGVDRKGSPPAFPSLVDYQKHLTDLQVTTIIQNGKGRMPSFPNVADARLTALLDYLKSGTDEDVNRGSIAPSPNRKEVAGAQVYKARCAICHGEDLLGASPNYPALVSIRGRLSDQQILAIVHQGKGRMPAFNDLSSSDTLNLLHFLGESNAPVDGTAVASRPSDKQEIEPATVPPGDARRFCFGGYRKFLDPDGYPGVVPPWGTLNAIDLNTGKYLWKVPLGNYPELAAKGLPDTGTENYGGPIATAGNVVFIGATNFDHTLRAFDSRTGRILWQGDLPYAGNATPATYMVNGKQYVVIAASNARNPKAKQGAAYVAFALP